MKLTVVLCLIVAILVCAMIQESESCRGHRRRTTTTTAPTTTTQTTTTTTTTASMGRRKRNIMDFLLLPEFEELFCNFLYKCGPHKHGGHECNNTITTTTAATTTTITTQATTQATTQPTNSTA
ncbi:leucine-rich repeat-containing protein AAC1-like [Nylanderia fulva]|uniref:leucine-rich repeat-containing protein AAC1-like n=1 Tax=Nylanderia fulva TaxID=613905 RepID=UPI0010FB818D|nr:leucine-rich repeat-containing protein AAC1-like [Nylanderia fulva]